MKQTSPKRLVQAMSFVWLILVSFVLPCGLTLIVNVASCFATRMLLSPDAGSHFPCYRENMEIIGPQWRVVGQYSFTSALRWAVVLGMHPWKLYIMAFGCVAYWPPPNSRWE